MNILGLTYEEVRQKIARTYGRDRFLAAAVYREVLKKGNLDLARVKELKRAPDLVHALAKDLDVDPGRVVKQETEEELTKFVTRLGDGLEIESVIIPMFTHNTLCVSSQVGCRMGCRFCETAKLGLIRNLRAFEIVGQVHTARTVFHKEIRNIVFMGMGEPLDNFDNVIQAVRVLNDSRGLDIALSRMTLSTVGKVDGIRRLANLNIPQLNLALSLNAPTNRIRSKIMPVNRVFPMEMVKAALMEYPVPRRAGSFFIEYVLIKGVNDTREDAERLVEFLKPLPVRINLIGYNRGKDAPFEAPSEEDVDRFRDYLIENKAFVRKRAVRGRSVMAACGQLGNRKPKRA